MIKKRGQVNIAAVFEAEQQNPCFTLILYLPPFGHQVAAEARLERLTQKSADPLITLLFPPYFTGRSKYVMLSLILALKNDFK